MASIRERIVIELVAFLLVEFECSSECNRDPEESEAKHPIILRWLIPIVVGFYHVDFVWAWVTD